MDFAARVCGFWWGAHVGYAQFGRVVGPDCRRTVGVDGILRLVERIGLSNWLYILYSKYEVVTIEESDRNMRCPVPTDP